VIAMILRPAQPDTCENIVSDWDSRVGTKPLRSPPCEWLWRQVQDTLWGLLYVAGRGGEFSGRSLPHLFILQTTHIEPDSVAASAAPGHFDRPEATVRDPDRENDQHDDGPQRWP
jgi:hypothetical protein